MSDGPLKGKYAVRTLSGETPPLGLVVNAGKAGLAWPRVRLFIGFACRGMSCLCRFSPPHKQTFLEQTYFFPVLFFLFCLSPSSNIIVSDLLAVWIFARAFSESSALAVDFDSGDAVFFSD